MTVTDEQIVAQLGRVVNKVLQLRKQSMFTFEDVAFFPSEIHLMLVIRDKTATNATKMAEELGITKGAVSQTLSRLEHKGVITKSRDTANKNELTLAFTEFGAKAFGHYTRLVEGMHRRHLGALEGLDDAQRSAILHFLEHAEAMYGGIE